MKTILVILLLAITVNAAPLSGRVTDQNGNGVHGVTIQAVTQFPCQFTNTTTALSNSFGYYSMDVDEQCGFAVTATDRSDSFFPLGWFLVVNDSLSNIDFVKQ